MSSFPELEKLPGIEISRGELLAAHTTLKIGGPAELFVRVQTESGLARLLGFVRETETDFQILGLGSNVLLPDSGLPGVVALLEGEFLQTTFRDHGVEAGAGLPLSRLARVTVERGLAGMEALAGFPSTVGGAVVMNAGCYGVEIKDILESTVVLMADGARKVLLCEELEPGYRSTNLQGTATVVSRATFHLRPEDPQVARERLTRLNRQRRRSMPSGRPNAGSVFKNPAGDYAGRLVEACGLKGEQRGGAEVSRQHANVIVNNGGASSEDVLALMLLMHEEVEKRFGVSLDPELILGGALAQSWRAES